MFIEKRVYQGSSGRVYPLPFTDRIEEHPTDKQWDAVWLENEFVKFMILPEIGGRIHIGQVVCGGCGGGGVCVSGQGEGVMNMMRIHV